MSVPWLKFLIYLPIEFKVNPNSTTANKTLWDLALSPLSDLISSRSCPCLLISSHVGLLSFPLIQQPHSGLRFTLPSQLCSRCSQKSDFHFSWSHLKCHLRDTLPDHPSKVAPPTESLPVLSLYFIVLTVAITTWNYPVCLFIYLFTCLSLKK